MTNLLLAEHEPDVRRVLERNLQDDGFEVLPAVGTDVLSLAAGADLALVGSVETCRVLRGGERPERGSLPVIVLGPSGAGPGERATALELGADDYLTRPVVYEELRARIRAVLRRSGPARDIVEIDGLRLDLRTRRVTVAGTPVVLSAKEYALLAKLASDPDRTFGREQLLREVWGYPSRARTRTVDTHACRLRRKLDLPGAGRPFVVNEWGRGYRLLGW